ncbi:MAG: glucan biosynthesis protein G [Gammaproteobacteria bacterium]|nr:glucan biosynthesis protein G [Gammaproteobacteria bacterium]
MLKKFSGLLLILFIFPVNAAEQFSFQTVAEKARLLAAQPYQEPPSVPRFLLDLNYDQFKDIRFEPDKSLWRQHGSPFKVMLIPPGLFYRHAVRINVIDIEGVHELAFRKDYFTFADPDLERRIPPDLGYAGFELTYPLIEPKVQSQFIVFLGVSYFRGVGKDNTWGISSRGLALDTGLPTGEEFPSFIEYWLVQPAGNAREMMVYALLDGPSVTGAYQFNFLPGQNTLVKVRAVLFPRKTLQLVGIAPLTSMFYYGENTPRPKGHWRQQVHDSDGLLIENGNGEWSWRPLINPDSLEMDYFNTMDVQGFGLLQRNAAFTDYQDMSARYDIRPSTWVKPEGNWGPGKIVLVQIPTDGESNDNIVAFWSPNNPTPPQQPYEFRYTLAFGGPDLDQQSLGKSVNTFVGDGNVNGGGNLPGAYRVIVDFAGGSLAKLPASTNVEGVVTGLNNTEIVEEFTEYNQALGNWRLSILAKPAEEQPLELRAYLKVDQQTLSETWTYRLPAKNGILNLKE